MAISAKKVVVPWKVMKKVLVKLNPTKIRLRRDNYLTLGRMTPVFPPHRGEKCRELVLGDQSELDDVLGYNLYLQPMNFRILLTDWKKINYL